MPNLPTEEELRKNCEELLWSIALEDETDEQSVDRLVDFINHYATKRELEAKIEEAKYWEYNVVPGVRGAQLQYDIDKRLAELKAQKEQEIVWQNIAT